MARRSAVTGATSYTGRFIAQRLRERGEWVINLTRRPRGTTPPGVTDVAFPASSVAELARALDGIDTVYNTHWIRFERGSVTYGGAIETATMLLDAAAAAGIGRFVHVSVIHPSSNAPTAYFRAKARMEEIVRSRARSYAIVRPTVTFGPGDILVNNLAWTLRRLPIFGIPGDGRYPIQPVHVEDIARIAANAGASTDDLLVDAAGPERFSFDEFVRVVRSGVGSRALLVHLPVPLALAGASLIGAAVRDVVLRRDEVTELQAGLMVSDAPGLGTIRFSHWVREHGRELGQRWSNELDRHYRQAPA